MFAFSHDHTSFQAAQSIPSHALPTGTYHETDQRLLSQPTSSNRLRECPTLRTIRDRYRMTRCSEQLPRLDPWVSKLQVEFEGTPHRIVPSTPSCIVHRLRPVSAQDSVRLSPQRITYLTNQQSEKVRFRSPSSVLGEEGVCEKRAAAPYLPLTASARAGASHESGS